MSRSYESREIDRRLEAAARERAGGCDHGILFDEEEAKRILGSWVPTTPAEFISGNPSHALVRKRFPRLDGRCPKGCGYSGIGYASTAHYVYGDW